MNINRALDDAEAFDINMQAVDAAQQTADEVREATMQEATAARLEDDKSDESNMVASLKKFESKKEVKDTKRATKIARVQESTLVRKDESGSLANDFAGKNKEYHFNTDELVKIAQEFDELLNNPDATEQDIIAYITSRTATKPAEELTPAESRMLTGQNDKIFDFLTVLVDHRITQAKSGKEKVPPDKLKSLENFKAKITQAKEVYYTDNKQAITDVRKLISLADITVDERLSQKEAQKKLGETIEDLHTIIHNPPEFSTFMTKYLQLGESTSIVIEKVFEDTSDLLEKINPKLKESGLERPEIINIMKGVRVYQAARQICRNAEQQIEQMDRAGFTIPESVTPGKLAAYFFTLSSQARPSPDIIRQHYTRIFGNISGRG